MLIPVTHSTQCVTECAKCGFSGQANTTFVQPQSFYGPITRSNMAVRITLHTSRVLAYRDCLTRDRIAILIGAWGLAVQRWVWTNEKPYFFYAEVSALFTYWHGEMGEFARKQISLRKRARLLPMPWRCLSWMCGFNSDWKMLFWFALEYIGL